MDAHGSSGYCPFYHSHLYQRTAYIGITRYAPNCVTMCYNKSNDILSYTRRWLCPYREAIEALQVCAVQFCNREMYFTGDITHNEFTFAQILDSRSIRINNTERNNKERRGSFLIYREGCNCIACHDHSFFLTYGIARSMV